MLLQSLHVILFNIIILCNLFHITIAWKKNVSNCYEGWMKEKLFGKSLLILGDSQGKRLMNQLEIVMTNYSDNNKPHKLKYIDIDDVSVLPRCGLCKYMKMNCVSYGRWKKPIHHSHGPRNYGLKHPLCSDCSGCFAVKWEFYPPSTTPSLKSSRIRKEDDNNMQHLDAFQIEYIPIEFAREYVVQTLRNATTQENVVEYLLRKSPPDYIIFNVGLQTMPHSRLDEYRDNLHYYVNVLSKLKSTKLIWIGTSLVQHAHLNHIYKRSYDKIYEYNKVANDVVLSYPNVIDAIDPSPDIVVGREFNTDSFYIDAMHFHADYYSAYH